MSLLSSALLSVAAVIVVEALASPLYAQTPAVPDSITHRLAAVTVKADSSVQRSIFERVSDRAKVTYLARENRALERKLAHYDRVIAVLEARLDSLKAGRALKEHGIATLDSAVASARDRRLKLQAFLVSEIVPGGHGKVP